MTTAYSLTHLGDFFHMLTEAAATLIIAEDGDYDYDLAAAHLVEELKAVLKDRKGATPERIERMKLIHGAIKDWCLPKEKKEQGDGS